MEERKNDVREERERFKVSKQHLIRRQEKKEDEYLKEESIILADVKELKERPFKRLVKRNNN